MMGLLSKAAAPVIRAGIVVAIGAALLLSAALVGLKIADRITAIIVDRVAAAVAQTNAEWEGKIEKINAATERRAAEQIRTALQIQTAASDQVQAAQTQLAELKVLNAHLPDRPDCGLSGDRGRLLPD